MINHWLLNEMSIKAEGYFHTGQRARMWCTRQQRHLRRDWREATSGHARVSYTTADCEVQTLFFKESNCLKFLWLDKCWHVCYRNKGAYTQTLIQVNNRRSRIHTLYIHILQHAIIAYSSKKKTTCCLSPTHWYHIHILLYHDVWLTCSASNPVCPNNSVIYTYFAVIKLLHDIFNKMHISHLFVGKENKLTNKQIIGHVITGLE